jgi:hypothetical protein
MARFLKIGDKKIRKGSAKYYLFKEFIKGKYPIELLNDYAIGYGGRKSKKGYRKVKKETIYRYYEEFKAIMRDIISDHKKELRKAYTDFLNEVGKKRHKNALKKAKEEYSYQLKLLERAYEENMWNMIINFPGINSLKTRLERLKSHWK